MTLKVLYVQLATPSFAGIERVVDEVASELAGRYPDEFDIDVIYTSAYGEDLTGRSYTKIMSVAKQRKLLDVMVRARKVISAKDYDLIVVPQIEPTVIYWFASFGLKRRFVTHLHGNPKFEGLNWKSKI